jgi:hypothetical protein
MKTSKIHYFKIVQSRITNLKYLQIQKKKKFQDKNLISIQIDSKMWLKNLKFKAKIVFIHRNRII